LIVVFSMLCGFSAVAQKASIAGVVNPVESTAPIVNASVYLDNTNYGTITDSKGRYLIEDITPGKYVLVTTTLGYGILRKPIELSSDQVLTIDFSLEENVMDLPPVVIESVTLTGGNKGIRDIPGSAHYISPKDIQKFSYTDINRTLRAVPGINIQEEDGFGLRPNIGLRGTGVERSSKITIMEDGVLMAPAPYTAPAAYYFPTIGRMQAIEILKGSSQIKYGPHTTGGAINLISTQIPDEFSGRINLFAGSFGGMNLHAVVGNSHKNVGYSVETFQYKSDGFKKLDGGGSTGFDKKDFLAKLRFNTKKDAKIYQSITFKIGRATESSNETYLGLTEEDFNENPYRRYAASQMDNMSTEHTQLQVRHVLSLSKSFDITTTVYRSDFSRNWYKLDKVLPDSNSSKIKIGKLLDSPSEYASAYAVLTGSTSRIDDALHVKANNRDYYSQGVQSVLSYKFKTGKIVHDAELGVRFHQDQIDRFQWVDKYKMNNGIMMLTAKGTPGTESNRVEDANAFASYLQYKVKIGKLTAIPGLRYENILFTRKDYGKNDIERTGVDLSERSNQVNAFIPGIGVDYKWNKHLSSFAGVHKGFSPPGSKEGTLSEESINYELGTRYDKKSLKGQAVVFLNDYKNLLGTDLAAAGGGGTTDQFNGGEVQTKGLEFQVTYNLLALTSSFAFVAPFSVVYTYTDATFQNDFESDFDPWGDVSVGDQLPYVANNQLTFLMGLEHRSFGVNLSGKYMDEMRTIAGQGDMLPQEKTDAQFIMDFSANYQISKYAGIFLNITNLTNDVNVIARRPAGLRPGMPRAFNIGIKTNF